MTSPPGGYAPGLFHVAHRHIHRRQPRRLLLLLGGDPAPRRLQLGAQRARPPLVRRPPRVGARLAVGVEVI
jgi:hypothetical protein